MWGDFSEQALTAVSGISAKFEGLLRNALGFCFLANSLGGVKSLKKDTHTHKKNPTLAQN